MEELKSIAELRSIKGYKSKYKNELLSVLTLSKPVRKGKKSKTNFSKARISKIRKEFNESRYKFSKLKIKEIRKNLYEIENEKSPSESKIKEIERNLTGLEKNLSKIKNYYDYDDIEYRGIKNVKDLFDLSIDKDYYKPIIAKSAFDGSYIQYESKGDKGKNLSIKEYLNIIKPYLSAIINDHKIHGLVRYHSSSKASLEETASEGKIQLAIAINFISSKDSDETQTMHTKSNNIEIMMGNETDEIIEKLFESFLQKYQEGLEESMRGREFAYDSVDALYYNLNKVSLSRGRSYIDSPKWLKNKKATINPKNKDDKCFQYALTVALSYEQIEKDPQRISKIKPFNYCLNCFQSYTTENKLKKHKKVRENHDYSYVEMPEEDNEVLKYNQGEKSTRVPVIIYVDLESLLKKMNTCHNNPEKSSTTKINKHTPSGYSLFTQCSFDTTKK